MKNRKQTHRIVVATLLLISCFSSGVFAGEAKFNDIEYNTLAEAITAANTNGNGGTIQMLQDVTLTSALPAISVSGVLTFSLGGYELQADEAIGNVIEITEGYMNLNNGKIIGMVPLSCGAGTTVHMDIWLISKGTTCLLLDGATVSIEGFNFYGNILSISQSSISVEGNSFFSQDPSDYVDMSTYTVNKAHYSCTAGGNTYILEYQVQKKEGNILYNNDHFSTLEDAVQAANLRGGGTITLLDNVSVSKTININTTEPITIEMSHFSITDARTDSLDDYLIKAYAHLILQNGSFTQAESAAGASGLIFSNTNFFLTLDNITIQGTSYKGGYKLGAILVQGSADFKDINISDNTITNETYNMGGYVCAMGNITLHGKIVIANNKYTIENNNIAANFFGGRANLWLGDFETGDVGQATISAEDLDYGSNIHVSSMDTYQQPASYNEILVGNMSSIFFPYFHSDDYYNSVNNSYSSLLVFDNGSYLADEYYRTISSSHETYGNATVWMSNNAPFSIRLLNPDNEWTLNDYTWTAVENNFHYSLNNLTNYGTSVQLPTPTREGYIFRGWGMNINDTITYTSASTPTDFYAIWKIDPNSNYWVAKGYFDGEELFFPTLEDAFRTLGEMGGEITLLQDCSAGAEDDLRSYSELTIQGQNHTITDARGTGNGTDSEGTSSGNNLRESEGLFVADWPITFLNTRFSQSAESKSFHTFIYSQDVLRFDGCTISGLTYGDSTQSYIITNGLEITNSTIANNLTSHGTVNRIHCMGQSQISLTGSVSADLLRGANDFWSVYDNGLTEGSHVTVSLQTHESGGDDIRIGTGNLSTIQYIHSATPGLEFIYDNGSMCVDMYNHSVEAKHSMEQGSIWLSTNVTYKVILEPKVEDFTLDTTIYQGWTATEAGYECTFNKETLTLPQIKAEGYIFLGWKTEQDTTRYVTSVSQPCTLYGNWQVDPTSDVWVVKRADGTLVKDFVSAVTEDNKTGRSDTLTLLQDITLKESVTFIAPVMLNGNNKALSTLNENATITFSSTTPSTLQDIRFNTNTAVTISTPLKVTGLVSMRFTFIDGAYLIKIGELSAATNLYYMGTAPVSSDDILLMKGGIFADLSLFKSTSENIHPYIFDDGNMSINIIDREVTGHHTHDANSIWYASDDGGFDYTVITLENPDNLWKLTNDDIMDWTFVDGNYIHSISETPVTLPKPIRDGYTFTGWFEFHASTGQYTQVSSATTATVLEAQWTESTSTPYVVNNYQQNINNDQYTLFETDSLLGTTNDTVTPTPKTYTGFVTPQAQSTTIAADGSAVINYQYDREKYAVTFKDGHDNTIQSSEWKYGDTPTYSGETPTKTGTAEYSYTWNNAWTPAIATVDAVATYTATFDQIANTYTLTWVTDGDPLTGSYTEGSVAYGTTIVTPDTPTKQGFLFNGWNPTVESTMPAANTTYTATWKATSDTKYAVNYYQQNVEDDNYSLFETDTLTGTTGDEVTPAPKTYTGFVTPHPQTAAIAADGSTVINYQYEREQYTITFQDGNGNTLQVSNWKFGAMPSYGDTIIPKKDATAEYSYTWNNGWQPTLVTVSDTATYTATFDAKPVSYQLQWITDGDSLQGTYTSGNVEFGTAITTPDTPTKQGYTFKEWVPQPLATMPAENIAYTATWKESTSTPYVVNYYQQNIDDDQYTLFETDSLLGTTNDTVTPTPKSYAGFITPQPQTATIFADGSTIIDYQYAREQYTIIFKDGDDNVIQESAWKYGAIPVYTGNTPQKTATARVTYTWNNAWKPAITVVSDTATYTASFEADTIPPRDLSELQQAFGPAASVVEQQDGSILITLNDSINTSVSISDIWGDITLDLNGYSITGNQGSQSDLDGKPALALTSSTPAGAGTNLTIKDNSGNSGTVQGGRGYDGQDGTTSEDGEDGGNGGSAIVNESSFSIYSIENPVIVLGGDGGNGGNSTFGVGGNGGNGGAPGGNGGNGGEGGLRPGVGGQGAEGGQSGHEGQPIPIILGSNNPDDKGTYVDEQGYCPADGEGAVGYHLKQGMPTHYQLLFDSAAHVAGFIDIEWTAANIDSLQGHLSILFPALCPFGTYRADLYLKNENTGYISEAQTITFQVNVPKEKVLQMYSDVITLDLSDTTMTYNGFQWYHNSGNGYEIVPGATLPYYKEEGGLTGSYYVAILINGEWTRTCEQETKEMPARRGAQKVLRDQQLILITTEGDEYDMQGQTMK